jgi:Concanavalin A-like lectin/glucanases superfamily
VRSALLSPVRAGAWAATLFRMRDVSLAAMVVLAGGGSTSCSILTSFDGFGGGQGAPGGSGGSSSGGQEAPYPAAILKDHPLAYWRFGEASGTVAYDETGNASNEAHLGTGVTWSAPGAILHDSNTAVSLAGDQCLEVLGGSFDFPGANPYSLEGWVNISAAPDNIYRHLFIKDDENNAAGRQEYGVYLEANDGLSFERFVNSGSRNVVTQAPALNTWTYFVATYDGTQLTLYVNAMNVGTARDTRTQLSIQNPEYMGCKTFSYPGVEGDLDEFAIYDVALTQLQITTHYAASGR